MQQTLCAQKIVTGWNDQGDKGIKEMEVLFGRKQFQDTRAWRKTIQGVTDEWDTLTMEAEVADVRRALGSVKRLCEAGNTVVFSGKESYIQNDKTGNKTKIDQTGKGYVVNVCVSHFHWRSNP